MKIDFQPNSISYDELKGKLEAKFPEYKFTMRGKNLLIGSKSNTVGANIAIRKKKIFVAGNFPTLGGSILFAVSIVLLGVLIPLIVYFAAFHSKMKAFEKEIGEYIQEEVDILAKTPLEA